MEFDLSCVDVPGFLRRLGISNIQTTMEEARFSCPYPAHSFGDKNPSAYMNLETTAFICFSCGASGNAITFLSDIKQVSRTQAKQWIAETWAPNFADIENLKAFIEQMWKEQEEEIEDRYEFVPLDEIEIMKRRVDWNLASQRISSPDWRNHMARFGWIEYMLIQREFSPDILNMFEMCYDSFSNRPCITVRTRSGELVGFKGRAWKEDQWPKYMVIGDTERSLQARGEIYGFHPYDASKHVFGLNLSKTIDKTLIVIEGEFNVMAAHSMGYINAVGPSGSTLGPDQVEAIAGECDEVILLFDTDATSIQAYVTAKTKIEKAIRAFERYVRVRVCMDHQDDPADMTESSFHSLIESAQTSTLYKALNRSFDISLQTS